MVRHIQLGDHPGGRRQILNRLQSATEKLNQAESAFQASGAPLVGWVPWVGDQVDGARALLASVASATRIGEHLVEQVDVDLPTGPRPPGNLRFVVKLHRAFSAASRSFSALEKAPADLVGPVRSARISFNQRAAMIGHTLTNAADALLVANELLGGNGERRILVLAANNAEMRAEGSYLSYTLLSVDRGVFVPERGGSVTDLGRTAPLQNLPPTPAFFVGNYSTQLWSSLNLSANFPWTGQAARAMFARETGIEVDDVLAVDVPALSSLLGVTGPIRIAGIDEPLTESNAEAVLLRRLYEQYSLGSEDQRRAVLSNLADSVLRRLSSSLQDAFPVGQVLVAQVPSRHIMAWSHDAAVQGALSRLGANGAIDQVDPKSTFTLAVEAVEATKMDAFDIAVHAAYHVDLHPDRSATVSTTVEVTNLAPTKLPASSYIYGPDRFYSPIPGNYLANCFLWSPEGSIVAGSSPDGALRVVGASLDVKPGQQRSVTFLTQLPHAVVNGTFTMRLLPQPRLHPIAVSISVAENGHPVPIEGWSQGSLGVPRDVVAQVSPR